MINDWNKKTLLKRGWKQYKSKDGKLLFLCPVSDYPNIPTGTELRSIDGKKVIKGMSMVDADKDLILCGIMTDEDDNS